MIVERAGVPSATAPNISDKISPCDHLIISISLAFEAQPSHELR
jgi:hypothetical protein